LLLLPIGIMALRWSRIGLPILFFAAGFFWSGFRANLILDDQVSGSLEGIDLVVEGRIADLPVLGDRGVRFIFDVDRATLGNEVAIIPRRIQLGYYGRGTDLGVGDAWRLVVRLKQPRGFRNPGGFDYESYLFQQRIRATGYVRESPPPERLSRLDEETGWLLKFRLNRFRQDLSRSIHSKIPEDPLAGLVVAFANGDDDSISPEQWRILTRTGVGHLVAISGMNIGLVAGIFFFLVRGLWVRLGSAAVRVPGSRVAAFGALLAAAAYSALAGFAIPTQRALVMLFVGFLSRWSGRHVEPSVPIWLALLAVLIVDPLAVLSAGFWLSFLAVAVILWMVHGRPVQSWMDRMIAWGSMQMAITVSMIPVLLYLFQQVSLVGPIANMIAIPVIELIVIPATLAGVAGSFMLPDGVAAVPFRVAVDVLGWLWPALDWMASSRYAIWTQSPPALWAMGAATVGIAIMLMPRGLPLRWTGIFWCLPLIFHRAPVPEPGAVWFTMLDVGQGLSLVVRTTRHAMVYDTGARFSSRFDAGQAAVVPYLRQAGIRTLDMLVISHGDNDHIGGAGTLVGEFPPHRILTGVPDRILGSVACRSGQRWIWDGVRFEILGPVEGHRFRGNNGSCVLAIGGPYGRILVPGDIGVRAERALMLDRYDDLRADLLVVPHHGSKTSSSESFLDSVRPHTALLSAGYRNRYRHPHPEVMTRYRDREIAVLGSMESGALEWKMEKDGNSFRRFREYSRRYWHDR